MTKVVQERAFDWFGEKAFQNIKETLVGEGLWTSKNLMRVGNTMGLFANAMLKEEYGQKVTRHLNTFNMMV